MSNNWVVLGLEDIVDGVIIVSFYVIAPSKFWCLLPFAEVSKYPVALKGRKSFAFFGIFHK